VDMRRLLDRLRRGGRAVVGRSAAPAADAAPCHADAARYLVTTQTCAEARLALMRRDLPAAEHALQRAEAVEPDHPDLPELRARCELAHGRPDRAAALLDRARPGNATRRLLRLLLMMQTGRRAAAHLELTDWTRRADCPPAARVLTAYLHWRAGDAPAARRTLTPLTRERDHAPALRLAAVIELIDNQPAAAKTHLARLTQRFGHRPRTAALLRWLAPRGRHDQPVVRPELIDQLAAELLSRPEAIATLAAAQRWSPRAERLELLRRAIRRIVDDLAEPYPALEALAELSMLAGDLDAAERWAKRGLTIQPMSAKLALMLDRIDCAQASTEPEAASPVKAIGSFGILRRVAESHPDYPDVQRALYHRYHRAGMAVLADRHLEQWLARRPNDRVAQRLAQEAA